VNPEITRGTSGNDVLYGGGARDKLSGGVGNDRLFGGANKDVVKGEAGRDMIGGGAGIDKLYGGKGKTSADTFVFDTKVTKASVAKKHVDTIYDFGPKYDAFAFDDAAFTNKTIAKYLKGKAVGLDTPLKMKAGFFRAGDKALDRDDFFIFNQSTGKLYWDVDGSGSKAMVEIANVRFQKGEGTAITHKDFFFI
jgi:Ca2+-binding RTX toxin-like protein